MGIATITFQDEDGDTVGFTLNFEGTFDENSEAHRTALEIAEAVAEQSGIPLTRIDNVN